MKKFLSIIMALLLTTLTFASCGFQKQSTPAQSDYSNQPTDYLTETESQPSGSSLSSDYRSGQILIEGNIITLPIRLSDFINLGWTPFESLSDKTIKTEDSKILNSNCLSYIDFLKGSSTITGFIYNWTNEEINATDGFLAEIHIDSDNAVAVIPGDFETGKATKAEIISKWGQPYSTGTKNSEEEECEYEIDRNAGYFLDFDTESGVLTGVKYVNENKVTGAPTIVTTTQAPDTTQQTSAQQDSNPLSSIQIVVSDRVNVSALEALTSNDPFKLKVTGKGYDNSGTKYSRVILAGAPSGNDNYVIVLNNNTSSDIKNINLIAVAYDSNYAPVQFGLTSPGDTKIRQFSSDVTIPANDKGGVAFCNIDSSQIAGFAVLAYSYTDAAGQVHTNPLAETWLKTVYS